MTAQLSKIVRQGYNLVEFKKDCKAMFGDKHGVITLHFAHKPRAPITYFWDGSRYTRLWDKKPVDCTKGVKDHA